MAFSTPSDRQVERAKQAQAQRLGQPGAYGKRKRCIKGKSCGASCTSSANVCLVDLPWVGQSNIKKAVSLIKTATIKKKSPSFEPLSNKGPKTLEAREKLKDIFELLGTESKDGKVTKISGDIPEKDIKWQAAFGPGVKAVGAGSFGAFAAVPQDKLAKGLPKYPGGVGVKAGEIGINEVEAIRTLGKMDLGPQLIAARVGKFKKDPYGFNAEIASGMIAMSRVQGTPYYRFINPSEEVNSAVWKSWAALHKAGIAHNDAHGGNIIVDDKGKARFVDLGLAQINVKAALSEALGAARKGSYALDDDLFKSSTYTKIYDNLAKVALEMNKDGHPAARINSFMVSGILNPISDYENSAYWQAMTTSQAKKYIDILYEGI